MPHLFSTPKKTASRSRVRSVVLAGVLLTTVFVLLSGLRLWRDRETDIEQWRAHLSDTSLTLAEHVRQTFTAADLVLKSVTDHVNDTGIDTEADFRKALATQHIFEMLRDRAASAPQVSVATIVATNGDVINFTRSWPPPSINLADRDYFKAHLADPSLDVFLSVPVRNRGTGTWTFYFARKIKNGSGDTIGLTLVGLESAFFADFYSRITSSPGSAISLLRADGALLARYPMKDDIIGASYAEHPIFRAVLAEDRTAGTMITALPRAAESGNASPRMIAPRKVQDYPVVVNLTVLQDVILSNWWRTANITGISTALAASVLLGATLWIVRLLGRQEETLVALDEARAAAEAAGNAKAEFLAHMSHEIRTPLNAVIGLSNLLIDTKLDAKQKEFVGIISRSGDHLLSLLNNVLDLSRLEAGRIDVEQSPIDLADLVNGAIETLDTLKGTKSLDISGTVDPDVPPVVIGDLGRVTQIVLNLLSNAAKYTSTGHIMLRVSVTERGTRQCKLRFTVADTGEGISHEDQMRLFQPFERGRQSRGKDAGGSGLGLAISRRTVNLMGGRIGVVSEPGKGSTFWFDLPFAIGKPEPLTLSQTEIVPPAQTLRVLVAEDMPANQALVRAVLEKMGHSVMIVGDGAEAVEAVKQNSFDVALMDVQMPHVDGYEATRRIRELDGTRSTIPIIGVTAYARDADRRAVLDCGMNEYVSKPFRLVTLAAALQKVTESGNRFLPLCPDEPTTSSVDIDFDETVLDTLLAAVGKETFRELVCDFETTLDMLLAKLETAIALRDEQSLRVTAHRLIGVVGQFGGKSVADKARILESAAEDQLNDGARDLIQRCHRLRSEVVQWGREKASMS